ncbi:hypothetical protein GQ53DRAFT_817037 [Thozetella sp. PMI_491]|nr:hypothetical protein GQ53DRAFT_817037 [Thozetella sp. PMI_491]
MAAASSAINVTQFITFPGIRNVGTGLCLQAFGDPAGSVVQRTCDSSNIQQLWSTHAQSSGSNIFQLQSSFSQCMWTASDQNRKVIEASAAVAGSCVLSTGNGAPSNTLYRAQGAVPGQTVVWQSRVANTDTGFCLDGGNFQNVDMFPCSGSVFQQWAVGG